MSVQMEQQHSPFFRLVRFELHSHCLFHLQQALHLRLALHYGGQAALIDLHVLVTFDDEHILNFSHTAIECHFILVITHFIWIFRQQR